MAKCCVDIAGTLNRRVTIQSATRASDGQGGFVETWAVGNPAWASIEPVRAYEKYQAMQMQVPVSHKIVMRYDPTVTAASRIAYGTRIFWVKEVINEREDRRFLTIKAIESEGASTAEVTDGLLLMNGLQLIYQNGNTFGFN